MLTGLYLGLHHRLGEHQPDDRARCRGAVARAAAVPRRAALSCAAGENPLTVVAAGARRRLAGRREEAHGATAVRHASWPLWCHRADGRHAMPRPWWYLVDLHATALPRPPARRGGPRTAGSPPPVRGGWRTSCERREPKEAGAGTRRAAPARRRNPARRRGGRRGEGSGDRTGAAPRESGTPTVVLELAAASARPVVYLAYGRGAARDPQELIASVVPLGVLLPRARRDPVRLCIVRIGASVRWRSTSRRSKPRRSGGQPSADSHHGGWSGRSLHRRW